MLRTPDRGWTYVSNSESLGVGIGGVGALRFDRNAFTPHGDRMYVSSQRGTDRAPGLGITYEIRGPFHARTGRSVAS